MTLQKIEFEYDIPDGYKFVRYGEPINGEKFLSVDGSVIITFDSGMVATNRIIVEKIPEQEQQKQNPKRHKYADLIHAWAEGAEIQWKDGDYWKDIEDPGFYEYDEYRIKPKTKTIRFRNWYHTNGRVYASHSQCEENGPDFVKWLGDWQEVEVEE